MAEKSNDAETVLENLKTVMTLVGNIFRALDQSSDLANVPVDKDVFNASECEGRFWEDPPVACQHCPSCTKFEGAKFQSHMFRVCHSCKLVFNKWKKLDPANAEKARPMTNGKRKKKNKEGGEEKKKKIKK